MLVTGPDSVCITDEISAVAISVREVHGLHGHDRPGPTEAAGQGGQGFGDL